MKPLQDRMAHLEGAYDQVTHRLASMDRHVSSIDVKLDALALGLHSRIDDTYRDLLSKIDASSHMLDEKIDKRFMWTIGITVATILPLYFRR